MRLCFFWVWIWLGWGWVEAVGVAFGDFLESLVSARKSDSELDPDSTQALWDSGSSWSSSSFSEEEDP